MLIRVSKYKKVVISEFYPVIKLQNMVFFQYFPVHCRFQSFVLRWLQNKSIIFFHNSTVIYSNSKSLNNYIRRILPIVFPNQIRSFFNLVLYIPCQLRIFIQIRDKRRSNLNFFFFYFLYFHCFSLFFQSLRPSFFSFFSRPFKFFYHPFILFSFFIGFSTSCSRISSSSSTWQRLSFKKCF